ncbi:MAG: biopolymer transporter ExbD [Gemmatimonadetes bacterium]|nr:biopolymer transporter ExbD [Gemmatimonadota bacterium]
MRRVPSMVAEPNVVPMIDVMLVLLIIYMIGGMLSLRYHTVQLPDTGRTGPGAVPIVLSVAPGPRYTVNGTDIPVTELEARLRAIFDPRPEKLLYVDASRDVRYQSVVDVLGAVRGAGVTVTAIAPPSARRVP